MNNFIKTLIFLFIVGVLLCINYISSGDLTGREGSLIGILLSIFSIIATWIVTHMYSESQHKKAIEEVQEFHRTNLQTYAKKAAEKCNNLSNELNRLSVYLYEELDRPDIENVQEMLLTREERMSSAIHIVNTLKSVNDTALSDWEGVIGEFLDEQREAEKEQKEELRDLIERVQEISDFQSDTNRENHDHTRTIKKEIDVLSRDIRTLIANTGIAQVKLRSTKRKSKLNVKILCIGCKTSLDYQQRPKVNGFKRIVCPSCNMELISFYNQDEGFYLKLNEHLTENIECPVCETKCECSLNNLPGSSAEIICNNCSENIRISRTIKSINIKKKGLSPSTGSRKLKEEDIETVKNVLPEQPWQRGVHKVVAKETGLSNAKVTRAIQELINRGIFKPQVKGILYVPETKIVTTSELTK